MDLFELGETFRSARLAANKTQQDIAELTGTTKTRISQFESGQLPGLGIVKLLGLFDSVGLEVFARPFGHGRTLDDVLAERSVSSATVQDGRQRVHRPRVRLATKNQTKG